jgi:transposase-like protein
MDISEAKILILRRSEEVEMLGPRVGRGPHPGRDGLERITITGLRKMPHWTFTVTLRPPQDDRGPEVLAVESEARDEKGERIPLTAEAHRRIPIGEVIRLAEGQYENPMVALVVASLGVEPKPRPYGGDIQHLRDVAAIYRAALDQGVATAKAISRAYGGVSDKTVSRWLSEARRTDDPENGRPVLGTHEDEKATHGPSTHEQQQIREAARRRAARARQTGN